VFLKGDKFMKTKSLLALLALSVALVFSGCSSSGDALKSDYDPNNPNTWLTAHIISSAASASDEPQSLTVRLTNRGSRDIVAASGNLKVLSKIGAPRTATDVTSFRSFNAINGNTIIEVPNKTNAVNFVDVFFVLAVDNPTRFNMNNILGGANGALTKRADGSDEIKTLNEMSTWEISLVDAPITL
jgi:hypothetical protein